MKPTSWTSLKAVIVGMLSGALIFFALDAVKAQQSLTVRDAHHDPKQYVNGRVSITGLASGIHADTKWVNGQKVPYTRMNLYEIDPKTNKKGSYYIWVSIPTSGFKFIPNEGDLVTIDGTLKWPYQFAMIDE